MKELNVTFRVKYDPTVSTPEQIAHILNQSQKDMSGDRWVVLENWGIEELGEIELLDLDDEQLTLDVPPPPLTDPAEREV